VLKLILAYVAALVVANLVVAAYGPTVMPFLAFALIGLDLALRNWLQLRLSRWQMAALILLASAISFILNPASHDIAVASALAFGAAALVEWGTFAAVRGSWAYRSTAAALAGAAVDSFVFPTLAFGAIFPAVVVAQFAAKAAGGAFWTWVLSRRRPA
jgi:uncharacterized PurR-regulated membrane protein YhhQ (DUF165 family)